MDREFLIDESTDKVRIAILENVILADIIIEKYEDRNIIGNIYKGRVNTVLPGMQAAFVDIGLGKDAFLPLTEHIEDILAEEEDFIGKIKKALKTVFHIPRTVKKGQEILVQVTKDPGGKKGARLTTNISITGRNLVFMPNVSHIGISKKIINKKERFRLREIIRKMTAPDQGFIVRTAGERKNAEEFIEEGRNLVVLWEKIKKKASTMPTPSLIYEELNIILKTIRDNFLPGDRIVVNSLTLYHKILDFVEMMLPSLRIKIRLYQKDRPLFSNYGLDAKIEEALQRRVKLRCGGYIVIDETEALTAIDVNTGKFVGGRNLEETVFRTNLEAAQEIARQVRLRSIGGIIIIDFIDMESAKNQEKVMKTLEEAFSNDKAKVNIIPLTEIGLVEMTRRRVRPSLSKILCRTCPQCGGSGLVRK